MKAQPVTALYSLKPQIITRPCQHSGTGSYDAREAPIAPYGTPLYSFLYPAQITPMAAHSHVYGFNIPTAGLPCVVKFKVDCRILCRDILEVLAH